VVKSGLIGALAVARPVPSEVFSFFFFHAIPVDGRRSYGGETGKWNLFFFFSLPDGVLFLFFLSLATTRIEEEVEMTIPTAVCLLLPFTGTFPFPSPPPR